MTPAQNQHGSDNNYTNVFERAFDGHMNAIPLIKGIGSKEAAEMAFQAANEYESTAEERKLIAEKLNQYSN